MRKIMFNIPHKIHSNLLHLICEDLPVENQNCKRAIIIYGTAFHCATSLVKLGRMVAAHDSLSMASNTLGYLAFKHNTNKFELLRNVEIYQSFCHKTAAS